ncbi:MAG: glucose/mannose-6-phosphate isomerase [Flammeovirgaceae bacterium]|jgi:glucose/mannose-6-phosphate isomerase
MIELFEGFSRMLREAVKIGGDIRVTQPTNEIRNVLIAGLGGSGIGGTLADAITYGDISVPISVSKSYDIPSWVNEHTLFIASSFSGNTEETLETVEKAQAKGAKIVAITTGGKLEALAKAENFDCIMFEGEAPCPRQHLPYSLTLLLLTLKKFDLTNIDFAGITTKSADSVDENSKAMISEAKSIASQLSGKFPISYSGSKFAGVTTRFQQQITENAKQLTHTNVFPEMNHNELVGWEKGEVILNNSVVLLFRSSLDHARVSMRMDLSHKVFEKKASNVIVINAKGDTVLEQSLYLISLTDWISFFLAEENQVDPFPVDVITSLKNELAKMG